MKFDESAQPIRVAYTLEQCWHRTPGGTARAALRVARMLKDDPEVEIHQVAGRHALAPPADFLPTGKVAMLPLARPWLYETWTRLNWPKVESVIGSIDVAHATGLVPCATAAPLVVTLHDLAFVHDPDMFSSHGVRLMLRSLEVIKRRADRILCPSQATIDDCLDAGLEASKLRLVPLGVEGRAATPFAVERVKRNYQLPDDFVLFVGTIEPRKNLARLVAAMATRAPGQPLVVAGAPGWGDAAPQAGTPNVRFLGYVPDADLGPLYAAATVFAYPSEREGFGLPVAEAMLQGTPVVTSSGTSTEEVADGAAVLVDPRNVASIADGIDEANDRSSELAALGTRRAGELTWTAAAERTRDVYRELAPAGGDAMEP
ncbi:glycosyltransferase family 4 protein [Ilumatobacter sp.]|uniref:glycosyltransferase family 4 protein n=1 Tax=Ilumatobacter sp. TaxID=1967498 RepID=UPI002A2FDF03|nr:glycosyltransferase family 1 protein [Ilumatobacter sp.]